jgi:hypothetical protein
MRRYAAFVVAIGVLATALAVYTASCGGIEGRPRCGPASAPAVLISVAGLVLDSRICGAMASEASARAWIGIVCLAISAIACTIGVRLRSRFRAGGRRR